MSVPTEESAGATATGDAIIRPFHVSVPEEDLVELRSTLSWWSSRGGSSASGLGAPAA